MRSAAQRSGLPVVVLVAADRLPAGAGRTARAVSPHVSCSDRARRRHRCDFSEPEAVGAAIDGMGGSFSMACTTVAVVAIRSDG
jgi:hypothetical protein